MRDEELNFNTLFHGERDKNQLRLYADEIIGMYGIKCILKRWKKNSTVLDPLYQDSIPGLESDEDIFETYPTYVYVEYNRLNTVLSSYGLNIDKNSTLNGMMKLEDKPRAGDIIELKLPYDNMLYKFNITSANIHRDICYSTILVIHNDERVTL